MDSKALPLAELKRIVADLLAPKAWLYWADFLGTAVIAWVSFFLTERSAPLSLAEICYFTVSVFAFYRAALFIHELTHQDRNTLPYFSWAYNLLIGIPMLVPSFMYRGVHIDHHRKGTYGTDEDGEYLPFGASPLWRSFFYVGQSVLIPFLLVLRFGILAPLSLLHPRIRRFIMLHCSALAIRTDTARRLPAPGSEDARNWNVLEVMCFAWVLGLFILFSTGILNVGMLRHIYLLLFFTFVVNSVRTIVAHRYRNRAAKEVTFTDQFLDSINIERPGILMELLAPVGLRYHALHHLFPSMPYHNLGIAHRRLTAILPPESPYHEATEHTIFSAFTTHWRNTRQAQAREAEELARSTFRI